MSKPDWSEEFVLKREDVPEELRDLWDRAIVLPVPNRPMELAEERRDG